ncbi:37S ribosomal protein S24, mitochondrial [Komagataella phaffii CBS 7435]|uniref:Small ribosomal subunit protein mS35 n=2 Tax=Komagataella phaffii TaxID=460519 RepID=C4R2A3_KOMPG|nr:mitochondrial 37S ribosomal protein RSM24 [Komagataella phaffii GS115]AOA63072.1 GQ67_01046T0 [Komagataella phaffii]CAH2447821.1 37S ribosomal protein S24, mitochondrial [Komagataella phaffii CBS 7435]AOA67308.1 GQ68_00343T0 [Komagataella phaffii GS115]CAY69627.1 hypothetical protein PAS_chr2-2_0487 [Komagataella phaffii GS115]CCA37992.1 37S ribosomal protein S24, mitochondrial [Komagataella phaffii CBS 7435]
MHRVVRNFHQAVRLLQETPLFLTPEKWKGLPSEKIFQLYQERVLSLGPKYTKDKHELEALLSTSKDTGFTYRQIQKIYEGGEISAYEVERKSVADDFKPQPFMFDDYPSQAHDLIDEHREQRYYNRVAAYELPQLAKFRQEFKKPSPTEKPLRFRYTTYLGESHPAERKVVLECRVSDLQLGPKESHKFKLLASVRYDHSTGLFKMSSDRFPEPTQNAKYLTQMFNRLLAESKNLKDSFEDVPLDTRHTKAKLSKKHRKKDYKFPASWNRPEDAPKPSMDVFREIYQQQKV